MTPEFMQQLVDYTFWGYDRLWASVDTLTDEQFTQPLPYSMGSLRNHLVHVMSVSLRWLNRLEQVEVQPHLNFEDYPTRAATRALWANGQARIQTFSDGLTQAYLDAPFTWELPARKLKLTHTRAQIMFQIVNHATDHRVQLLAMLDTHFGAPTFEQDWVLYLADKSSAV